MTDAPQMRWLRLWTDVIDDPKLLLLSPDDRWYYIAILACKRTGVMDEPDSVETRDRKMALSLRLDHRERDEVRRRLVEARLIDEDWQPLGWEKRQFASDSSTARVREYRKRYGNVSETPQIRDRADTEQRQKKNGEERATRAPTAKRLPQDFTLTEERRRLCEREGVEPIREFERFRDHWLSASGASARKHDWDAAWRNWCRKAADYGAPRGTAPERTWRPDPNNPEDNGPC